MQTATEIAEATPQMSDNPEEGMTEDTMSLTCASLFDVITITKKMTGGPLNRKIALWRWMIENGCERTKEVSMVLYGEISPAEFCVIHPHHPACQAAEREPPG